MNNKYIKSYSYPFIESAALVKTDCLGLSGIYLILNNITNDCYIGSAISKTLKHNRLYFRFRNHFFIKEKMGSPTNIKLYRAIFKYGLLNFSFHILEFTQINETRARETFYIETYKPNYNIVQYALDGSVGYKHRAAETKAHMKNVYTEERRLQIGNLNRDKIFSKETRRSLISKAAIIRNNSVEYKQKQELLNFINSRSRPASVYKDSVLVKTYSSAKEITKEYNIGYRTIRRHIKSGEPIRKLEGIVIKYKE